jgi:hypothetical protein
LLPLFLHSVATGSTINRWGLESVARCALRRKKKGLKGTEFIIYIRATI